MGNLPSQDIEATDISGPAKSFPVRIDVEKTFVRDNISLVCLHNTTAYTVFTALTCCVPESQNNNFGYTYSALGEFFQ